VPTAIEGLTRQEVAERIARGQVNDVPAVPSRTVGHIVRANVFTRFNALLGSLLVVILIVGPIQDALFGFVLIANAGVGIFQELRAKRTLDGLAVLTSPQARIVRDGEVREVPVTEIVLDDVLELQPGDQIVVDGEVLEAAALEVDDADVKRAGEALVTRIGRLADAARGTDRAAVQRALDEVESAARQLAATCDVPVDQVGG